LVTKTVLKTFTKLLTQSVRKTVTQHNYGTVYETAYLSASSQSVIPYFGTKEAIEGTT
jgi:hypothetical protein